MYSEITANKRKTVVIMVCFLIFAGLIGLVLGMLYGKSSAAAAGIFALTYTGIMYLAGARLSLAVSGARQIQKRDDPRLWRAIENLAIADGLPMPRVYVIDDPAPNAFATGRTPATSSICVTTGLLEIMDGTELEGVLAHELGHIKNYDIRVSMIAFALSAVISVLADFILRMTWFRDRDNNTTNPVFLAAGIAAAIVAPVVASMIQLAISRKREYLADATGALTTRYPEGLANALKKIGQYGQPMRHQNTATAHLFFANPLSGKGISNLFSTHPPIEERIRRLEEMGRHA